MTNYETALLRVNDLIEAVDRHVEAHEDAYDNAVFCRDKLSIQGNQYNFIEEVVGKTNRQVIFFFDKHTDNEQGRYHKDGLELDNTAPKYKDFLEWNEPKLAIYMNKDITVDRDDKGKIICVDLTVKGEPSPDHYFAIAHDNIQDFIQLRYRRNKGQVSNHRFNMTIEVDRRESINGLFPF